MNTKVDWKAIKAEYIAGGTSYRKLAEKYGVSFSTLKEWAKREKWTDLKAQADHKTNTILTERIGKRNAKKSAKIDALTDRLLDKIGEMMDVLIVEGKDVKSIASALKDIRELKGIKDKLDEKEQKARIAKLQKEASADEKEDKSIVIQIVGDAKDYSK